MDLNKISLIISYPKIIHTRRPCSTGNAVVQHYTEYILDETRANGFLVVHETFMLVCKEILKY